jgi:nucleoside-diphosphate-sugar epimerase
MLRAAITGSSGMIGTTLGLKLIQMGAEVHGLDCRPNTWTQAFPSSLVDLTIKGSLQDFHAEVDVVIHLAAHAKVHASVENPRLAFDNIAMGEAALEFARERRVPLVLGSSREVYGNGALTPKSEPAVFVNKSASPYSAAKLAVEALAHSYNRCFGMPIAVLRFSNVYGRFDSDVARLERVVPLFIQRIRASEPITIYGPEKVLDFTYVDDCVDGIVRAVGRLHAGMLEGETINIASGKGHGLIALANYIGRALGKPPLIRTHPSRAGEVTHYVADLSLARAKLGYSPRTQLHEGARRAVDWHLSTGMGLTHVA